MGGRKSSDGLKQSNRHEQQRGGDDDGDEKHHTPTRWIAGGAARLRTAVWGTIAGCNQFISRSINRSIAWYYLEDRIEINALRGSRSIQSTPPTTAHNPPVQPMILTCTYHHCSHLPLRNSRTEDKPPASSHARTRARARRRALRRPGRHHGRGRGHGAGSLTGDGRGDGAGPPGGRGPAAAGAPAGLPLHPPVPAAAAGGGGGRQDPGAPGTGCVGWRGVGCTAGWWWVDDGAAIEANPPRSLVLTLTHLHAPHDQSMQSIDRISTVHWWQQSVYYIRPASARGGGGKSAAGAGASGAALRGKHIARYSDRYKRQQEQEGARCGPCAWLVWWAVLSLVVDWLGRGPMCTCRPLTA